MTAVIVSSAFANPSTLTRAHARRFIMITLIELVVLSSIIGIVATIAWPM
jgi:hypothetical protein